MGAPRTATKEQAEPSRTKGPCHEKDSKGKATLEPADGRPLGAPGPIRLKGQPSTSAAEKVQESGLFWWGLFWGWGGRDFTSLEASLHAILGQILLFRERGTCSSLKERVKAEIAGLHGSSDLFLIILQPGLESAKTLQTQALNSLKALKTPESPQPSIAPSPEILNPSPQSQTPKPHTRPPQNPKIPNPKP